MAKRILFIGGTGTISEACTRLAVEHGMEVTILNRGRRDVDVPPEVAKLEGDVRDPAAYAAALGSLTFDAAVNFVAFTPDHVETDLAVLSGRVGQYVFISSASAYLKPPASHVVTEDTRLENPYWEYSRRKIACERRVMDAFRNDGFPGLIVRPSYTYGDRLIPLAYGGGYTAVARMRAGKPVIVHGDGSSLWTLTHNSDFAKGLVGLLGHPEAAGEAFHITSDEVLTWNQAYRATAAAAGVSDPKLVHVPSDFIVAHDPDALGSLTGDKTWSLVFDNAKIKRFVPSFRTTVPYAEGIRRTMAWFDADPARQAVDGAMDAKIDRILAAFSRGLPA